MKTARTSSAPAQAVARPPMVVAVRFGQEFLVEYQIRHLRDEPLGLKQNGNPVSPVMDKMLEKSMRRRDAHRSSYEQLVAAKAPAAVGP
jgi:hypothetical protein